MTRFCVPVEVTCISLRHCRHLFIFRFMKGDNTTTHSVGVSTRLNYLENYQMCSINISSIFHFFQKYLGYRQY